MTFYGSLLKNMHEITTVIAYLLNIWSLLVPVIAFSKKVGGALTSICSNLFVDATLWQSYKGWIEKHKTVQQNGIQYTILKCLL